MAILLLWSIWNTRNISSNNNQLPDINRARRQIAISFEDRPKNQDKNNFQAKLESLSSHSQWEPLEAGVWKLNADASWSENEECGGLDWAIRDSNRSLIGGGLQENFKDVEYKMSCSGSDY